MVLISAPINRASTGVSCILCLSDQDIAILLDPRVETEIKEHLSIVWTRIAVTNFPGDSLGDAFPKPMDTGTFLRM